MQSRSRSARKRHARGASEWTCLVLIPTLFLATVQGGATTAAPQGPRSTETGSASTPTTARAAPATRQTGTPAPTGWIDQAEKQ
ncbi:MAG TPA: hypothetical protein VFW45_08755, partial [Candidatus Polarisedimenticolia bacterium]|nr:hypothetical protein [Candidatus Polarisedimenticolia bacterium]